MGLFHNVIGATPWFPVFSTLDTTNETHVSVYFLKQWEDFTSTKYCKASRPPSCFFANSKIIVYISESRTFPVFEDLL